MDIKEKADYRLEKFIRFIKEKKLYGKFKKKVISLCTKQNKTIFFAPSYDYNVNIMETNYMIYAYFHDEEKPPTKFYEMYEFFMTGEKDKTQKIYKNEIEEWRKLVKSENL